MAHLSSPARSRHPPGIPGRPGEAQATHVALLPGAGAGGAPLGDAEGAHLSEDLAERGVAWTREPTKKLRTIQGEMVVKNFLKKYE